jgi:hypothetical protein
MNYWDIGLILILFVVSYALFKIGETLSDSFGYNDDWEPFLWILTIIFFLIGSWYVSKENPIGFLGFIPSMTYILLKMSESIGIQEKIKKFIYSIIFSSLYFLANYLFDIKMTLSSIIILAITALLGLIGLLTT